MASDFLTSWLWLGDGGDESGLVAVKSDGQSLRLATGEIGHSVYAVDTVQDMVVSGDRTGLIDVWAVATLGSGPMAEPHVRLNQEAPVLSVCLLDGFRLVVSDAAGRCVLWRLDDLSSAPTTLTTHSGRIASLLHLGEDQLWGVAEDGEVLLWGLGSGDILASWTGPRPSRPIALHRMCYWPSQDAIVFAGRHGELVSLRWPDRELTHSKVHNGDIGACMVAQDRLYTIGQADGRLLCWEQLGRGPAEVHEAPTGIIAGDAIADTPDRLLLVKSDGIARLYDLGSTGLSEVREISGMHHRTVAGNASPAREGYRARRHSQECLEIQGQIIEMITSGRFDGIDEFHSRLAALGAGELSATLRIRQAVRQGDPLGELAAWRSLLAVMPVRDPELLRRHVDLLVNLWLLPEAQAAYAPIANFCNDASFSGWLSTASDAMRHGDGFMESDIEIGVVAEAATMVGRAVVGRWLAGSSDPIILPSESITAAALVTEYGAIREKHDTDLPVAEMQTMRWVSKAKVCPVEMVLFSQERSQGMPQSLWGLAIQEVSQRHVLTPLTLLDIGERSHDESPAEHNEKVCRQWDWLGRQASNDPWPVELRERVGLAIRCVRNRQRWSWTGVEN